MEINILDLIVYILGTLLIVFISPKNAELDGIIYVGVWFLYTILYIVFFVIIDYDVIDLIEKISITF